MGDFKEKLRIILNDKDKDINNDILFNNSLLKIHKKIKRENNSKPIISKKNKSKSNNNGIIGNLEKSNFYNFSLDKPKKNKSTNTLDNFMRSFSIYDFHIYNKIKNCKFYFNHSTNNKIKTAFFNIQKISHNNINNKINYVNSLLNNYKAYSNNFKRKKNLIYRGNIFLNNKITACKNKTNFNLFRAENKYNFN